MTFCYLSFDAIHFPKILPLMSIFYHYHRVCLPLFYLLWPSSNFCLCTHCNLLPCSLKVRYMLRKFIAKFELAKHIHIHPYCKYDIRLINIFNFLTYFINSLLFVNIIYLKSCDLINVILFSYSSMPQNIH